jgi:hypothetical protein
MRLIHLNEWKYQLKPLWPLLLRRRGGGAEATRKDNASEMRPRKKKSKALRKSKNVVQPDIE